MKESCEKSIKALLISSIQHGDNVFRFNVSHDVVHLIKDKAAAWLENTHQFPYILRHSFRRAHI